LIRVLVVEEVQLMRAALLAVLSVEAGVEVVGVVGCHDEAVPVALALGPDVLLIDIDPHGEDGPAVAGRLHERFPQCRMLILTGARQPETLRQLTASDSSLVLKDAPPARLAEAIRKLAIGERFVDPDVMGATQSASECPLTDRELEVLRLAADGSTITEIGAKLCLSPRTVGNYLSTGTSKVAARNRLDAIRIARDAGWL